MISSTKEIKTYTLKDKTFIQDEFVNAFFIMELLDCQKNKAYKIMKKIRGLAKNDGIEIQEGSATLYYTYKFLGLRGNFE